MNNRKTFLKKLQSNNKTESFAYITHFITELIIKLLYSSSTYVITIMGILVILDDYKLIDYISNEFNRRHFIFYLMSLFLCIYIDYRNNNDSIIDQSINNSINFITKYNNKYINDKTSFNIANCILMFLSCIYLVISTLLYKYVIFIFLWIPNYYLIVDKEINGLLTKMIDNINILIFMTVIFNYNLNIIFKRICKLYKIYKDNKEK